MAAKVPNPANKSAQIPKSSGSIIKKLLIVFVILMLAGVGFALGIYLKLIDLQGLGDKWKLHDYPVIGQYFTPPKTNFETVDLEDQPAQMPTVPSQPAGQAPVQSLTPPLTPVDKDKQAKIKQQEEAKRISKLARLYENMKPDEAVAILSKLDDTTIIDVFNRMDEAQVAKIMAQFDADRAARISQAMLKGKTPAIL